jgi:hypothetical protein
MTMRTKISKTKQSPTLLKHPYLVAVRLPNKKKTVLYEFPTKKGQRGFAQNLKKIGAYSVWTKELTTKDENQN